jgi:hypothetical protein
LDSSDIKRRGLLNARLFGNPSRSYVVDKPAIAHAKRVSH